jgi:tetratricopeptide (TPR) repeat protein
MAFRPWLAAAVLAAAIAVVYGPALGVPLIYDDLDAIIANPSIRSLWPPVGDDERRGPLNPPADLPTAGRPLVNLSFALNYSFAGLEPAGYHGFNAVIHFGAALLVFGIVRRTLLLPYFRGRFDNSAGWLGLTTALLWSLHPLQTEAVIYATQRTELMMAFFYLATLYCSLRYWLSFPLPPEEGQGEGAQTRPARRPWLVLAVVVCACGMASKEVMVSAPLIVLLYDRAFISGSLRQALRRSWPLYAGLAATWLVLLALNLSAPRQRSAGFGMGPPAYVWWMTQAQVLATYIKLVVWPSPLLIHYRWPYLTTLADAWMYLLPVLVLGLGTLLLLWRNHPLGYLGTWVFAILAPTSVVPILTEMAAERRMYLPLAAIVALAVVGGYVLVHSTLNRKADTSHSPRPSRSLAAVAIAPAFFLAILFGFLSTKRLAAYADEGQLWREVVEHQPGNFVAHANLGHFLAMDPRRHDEAIAELQTALSIKPDYPAALANLGLALTHAGRLPAAIEALNQALVLEPENPGALNNLGIALTHAGRAPEAVDVLRRSLARDPESPDALNNLGFALLEIGDYPRAIECFEHALRLDPQYGEAHANLGRAYLRTAQLDEAITELEAAQELLPDNHIVLDSLGSAYLQLNRLPEARRQFEQALQRKPDYRPALNNLAMALYYSGEVPQAIDQFRNYAKLHPDDASPYCNLGNIYAEQGNAEQAIAHYEQAVKLKPDFAEAQLNLGIALAGNGRLDQAIKHLQAAVKAKPDLIPAYAHLVQTLVAADRSDEAIKTAGQAMKVARSTGRNELAQQMEQWLEQYQAKLKSASPKSTSP